MKNREIYITGHDMARLRDIIEVYGGKDKPYLEQLESELDRAKVVDPKDIPHDIVTMNSRIRVKDLESKKEDVFILVFPDKAGTNGQTLSVLAPVGTALIGYREGDIVEWEVPAGIKRMQIMEIMYQPERVGNYEL